MFSSTCGSSSGKSKESKLNSSAIFSCFDKSFSSVALTTSCKNFLFGFWTSSFSSAFGSLAISSILKALSKSDSSKPSFSPFGCSCTFGFSSWAFGSSAGSCVWLSSSKESALKSAVSSGAISVKLSCSPVSSCETGGCSSLMRVIRSVGKKGLCKICISSCILLSLELKQISFLHLFSKFFKSALISLSMMMIS